MAKEKEPTFRDVQWVQFVLTEDLRIFKHYAYKHSPEECQKFMRDFEDALQSAHNIPKDEEKEMNKDAVRLAYALLENSFATIHDAWKKGTLTGVLGTYKRELNAIDNRSELGPTEKADKFRAEYKKFKDNNKENSFAIDEAKKTLQEFLEKVNTQAEQAEQERTKQEQEQRAQKAQAPTLDLQAQPRKAGSRGSQSNEQFLEETRRKRDNAKDDAEREKLDRMYKQYGGK